MEIRNLMMAMCAPLLIMASCSEGNKPVQQVHETALQTNVRRTREREEIAGKPIEQGKIDTLLRAAMAAPSGMDKRPWEFVVIDKREVLDSLAAGLSNARMLARAPLAIIVCGNEKKSSYWYLDCSAAAQNVLVTACSLGLGAVWTAAYPYEDRMNVIRSCVYLPEDVKPLCVIPVGYPGKDFSPKNKWDESRIHYNAWE